MKTINKREQKARRIAEKMQDQHALDDHYIASQGRLMWLRFKRNRLAMLGGAVLCIVYAIAIFCEFLSPYSSNTFNGEIVNLPPQTLRFFDAEQGFSLRPFVYGIEKTYDPVTWKQIYIEDEQNRQYLSFFVRGESYKLLGLFETDVHLFGIEDPNGVHLFGTDTLGRDLFSRTLTGTRISSTIGLVGVLSSVLIGLVLGGLSGYLGGTADLIIQRLIDFTISLPSIPLWMALAAAVPPTWTVIQTYFCITLILSLISWPGLARTVRSKIISLKNEEYVKAAIVSGARTHHIIIRHMLPMITSHLIASLSLSIPGMILGETSLSYLGIGLRAPAVSWGVLLSDTQKFRNVALYPWTLIPGIFVIITVMSFNFVGDGLRDASDPYA